METVKRGEMKLLAKLTTSLFMIGKPETRLLIIPLFIFYSVIFPDAQH